MYLVFEFVQGGELLRILRQESYFPNDVALFYVSEITLALEYLHYNEIIYRDLKPENLLISSDGHIKLTDFGFAKKIKGKTYTLCGTPDYIAPEILLAIGYNHCADLWSLGILLFELLSGYPPFFDMNPSNIY